MVSLDVADSVRGAMDDPEFSREMRFFTGAVKIAVADEETVAEFDDGALVQVGAREVPDEQCDIVVKGTEEHWNNLLALYPVPFYQCLQTANVKHGLELSANKETFAYLPALNRLVQILRAENKVKEGAQ